MGALAIQIPRMDPTRNRYVADGRFWLAVNLWRHAEGLPVFDCPAAALRTGYSMFCCTDSIQGLASHVARVLDADLSYPIILSPDGDIMDGGHRVAKAIVEGVPTIKAVRFVSMPPSDGEDRE